MAEDWPLLTIGPEDVGGMSWWAGRLATPVSRSGTAQLRFVGPVGGERVYRGGARDGQPR